MDLFEMFGVPMDVAAEEEKSKKKVGTKGKKEEKKGTAAPAGKKKEETYALPMTIYTGYREPLAIPADGKKRISLSALMDKLQERYPEYRKSYTNMQVDGSAHEAWAAFSSEKEVAKGEIELKKGDQLTLAGHVMDLSSVMTDETCSVSLEEIVEVLKAQHPSLYNAGIVKDGMQMAPIFHVPELTETLKFPIRLSLYGRENWQITQEEYDQFVRSLGNELEGNAVYDKRTLEAMVIARYPDFREHLALLYLKDENIVVVSMHVMPAPKKGTAKETMYPTEGTTLSFIFQRVELSPKEFGGKTEVTKKELIAYCARMYPEFDNDQTEIRYDKERKLLIPVLQGSKKG